MVCTDMSPYLHQYASLVGVKLQVTKRVERERQRQNKKFDNKKQRHIEQTTNTSHRKEECYPRS